jgi:hypothetical protein
VLKEPLISCGSCAGTTTNPDCDGLPGADRLKPRDPYPQQCNKLLWEDHFDQPVASRWKSWGNTADARWRWSCGWYHQDWTGGDYPESMHMAWTRANLPTKTLENADYLVEARVTLGAIGNPQTWGVGIVARYTPEYPFANIVCEARVDSVPGSPGLRSEPIVADPDVRVETRIDAANDKWTAGWPRPPRVKTFDGGEGRTYYLQLWYTSNFIDDPTCTTNCKAIVCRVCDDTVCYRTGLLGLWINNVEYLLPTAPGSVGLRTYGRAASFDYIRVFQLTDP